jgi:outer membrane protein
LRPKFFRVRKVFILLFTIYACSTVSAQQQWDLRACVDYALKNNISIRQAELQQSSQKKQYTQSVLNTFLPTANASLNYNVSFGNSVNQFTYSITNGSLQTVTGNVSANLNLFTGLQQLNGIKKSSFDHQASAFDAEDTRNNIMLSVTSTYLQILLNKELVRVAEEQLKLTTEQLVTTQNRITAGSLPDVAIYDVEAQRARNQSDIINARNQVILAELNLKNLLQIPDNEKFEVAVPDVTNIPMDLVDSTKVDDIVKYAYGTQPSIKAADARLRSSLASYRISQGGFSPTLSAFAQIGSNFSDNNTRATSYKKDSAFFNGIFLGLQDVPDKTEITPLRIQFDNSLRKVIGLSLNIPLSAKGQNFTNVQLSKIQTQVQQLELQNKKTQLRQTINEAFANAKAAAESFVSNKRSFEAADRSYDANKKRYEIGLLNQYDFERSRISLITAESQMLQSKYTYIFRKKVLDFYQGKQITLQ